MTMISGPTRLAPLGVMMALFGATANAALLSVDYIDGSGDGWLTYDTATGLQWLDVSLTTNMTIDEVRTGDWYAAGFRYATRSEVETLFQNAGTPDDNFNLSVSYPAETLALAQLLGPTLVVEPYRVTVAGLMGTDFFGNDVTLDTHPIGTVFSAQLGKVDYLDISGFGTLGEAHFSGGHPFSDEPDPSYGSFLVRDTNVPEPETLR